MNTLAQMMGLNPQGVPNELGFQMEDPYLQMAMQGQDPALMAQQGVQLPPMDNPYQDMGMSGQALATQMLGQPAPQITQEEVNALAQALGLGTNSMVENGVAIDPMLSQNFNLLGALGGYNDGI